MNSKLYIQKFNLWANELRSGVSEYTKGQADELLLSVKMHNKWFTEENIYLAVNAIADMISDIKNIEIFLEKYKIRSKTPKKILLILAGNIPGVGFHDILCTLLSGHYAMVKLSSSDKFLLKWIFEKSFVFFPEWHEKIIYSNSIENSFDAVIATGSNQSAKTFEKYFSSKPNLIRHSRSSVAVLCNNDTDEDLKKLGNDIFSYFGLGCRNVSLVFFPHNFDKNRLFSALKSWKYLEMHNAYSNNYIYYKSYFSLSNEILLDGEFYLLRKNDSTHAPVSVLNYIEYDDIANVHQYLIKNKEQIQCVVSSSMEIINHIDFGQTQKPTISDYADGVDTMRFLTTL